METLLYREKATEKWGLHSKCEFINSLSPLLVWHVPKSLIGTKIGHLLGSEMQPMKLPFSADQMT